MAKRLSRRQFVSRTAAAAGVMAGGFPGPAIVRAAGAGQWGDLRGRLVYDGTPPARKKLVVDKDVECCGKFDIRDESLMVGEQRGLGNVYIFVYLRSREKIDICPALEETVEKRVTLDNRDCIFIPHCMKIWYTQQEFHTVNSDPVAQNISYTALGDANENFPLPVGGEATRKFTRRQRFPVPIACNYHPWESAYILPLDHPYVAITAMDGRFEIPKLPFGRWEFRIWHERVGFLKTTQWPTGRLKRTITSGVNDLGTIKLAPALLEKQ